MEVSCMYVTFTVKNKYLYQLNFQDESTICTVQSVQICRCFLMIGIIHDYWFSLYTAMLRP